MKSKRVASRGIVFYQDKIVLLHRIRREGEKFFEYYAIPGGGVEELETLEEACLREVFEEVSLKTKINTYLGIDSYDRGITHYYLLDYLEGIPKLGGYEKEQNNPDNFYEVVLIDVSDLDGLSIPGLGLNMILKSLKVK